MARGHSPGAPRILGVTGPIGCGKTTVGDLLLELGAVERIDADRVVHGLMAAGTPVTARVRQAFGDEVIAADGSVDRRHLASIVFSDSRRLRALEAITHPAVRDAIHARLREQRGRDGVVVIDAVRLLQSDLLQLVDEVWVVTCPQQTQLARLTTTRRMTHSEALDRIRAQPSFEHSRVSRIIMNAGSREDLRRQVEAAWTSFRSPRP
jgi:dephospho-CoA kinase